MKKLILFCVLLLLCGCSAPQANQKPNHSETTVTIVDKSVLPTEECTLETTGTWGTPPEVILDIETEVVEDDEGMVPLLLIVPDVYEDRAYILCAGKDGKLYQADQFKYDGAPLYGTYLYEGRMVLKDEPATTRILEDNKALCFTNTTGGKITMEHQGVITSGEVSAQRIFVYACLPKDITLNDELYVGSYADINIFPQNAEYEQNSIVTDLDGNGTEDNITWELSAKEPFDYPELNYSDYLYDYSIKVKRNGIEYIIESYIGEPVCKDDVQVFVADVDQDADFELIVFEKTNLNWRNVMIYDFDGTKYVMREQCPVT